MKTGSLKLKPMIILLSCAFMVEYSTLKQVFCNNFSYGLGTVIALSTLIDVRFSRFCIKLMASKLKTDDVVSEVIEMPDS